MLTLIEGRHYFEIPTYTTTQRTVSFGIWPAVAGKAGIKKGKAVVIIRTPRETMDPAHKPAPHVGRLDFLVANRCPGRG